MVASEEISDMPSNVQLQKAFLKTEKNEKIECMFNPAKFTKYVIHSLI